MGGRERKTHNIQFFRLSNRSFVFDISGIFFGDGTITAQHVHKNLFSYWMCLHVWIVCKRGGWAISSDVCTEIRITCECHDVWETWHVYANVWVCLFVVGVIFILQIVHISPQRLRHITPQLYLGICSAISSKLSDGLIGVFSNKRDGASVRCPVESLTHRNTLPPRRCRWRCCSADFFRLFSCSRCRLCRRKKNIDMLTDRRGWGGGWFGYVLLLNRRTWNVSVNC